MKVRSGISIRQTARYFGYQPSTIMRWVRKADRDCLHGANVLPTESSKPRSHPRQLPAAVVEQILDMRRQTKRGAEFIHYQLSQTGVRVSLSSVKRTLRRHGLTRYSKWKKWHQYSPRPLPEAPGLLVEADTIHDGAVGSQLYIYTLLDVHSRWAYAEASHRIKAGNSVSFMRHAQMTASFRFVTVQTDHGAEFSKWFTKKLTEQGITHRHSRVRKPNDNAHLERFNRTIQEECILRLPRKLQVWRKEIPHYLQHYNYERPHMGLNWQTPAEVLRRY